MKLIFIVTLAHFLVLFCFNLKKDIHEPKKNKIIVRTEKLLPVVAKTKVEKKQIEPQKMPEVAIAPVAPIPIIAPVVAPPIVKVVEKKEEPKKQQPTPKKVVTTTPNKTPAKPPQKKPAPVAKKVPPSSAKQAPAKKAPDKELLSLMKEGLNKIDKASTSLQKKGSSPSFEKIGTLKSESLEATAIELSYAEELALYLKHRLHFPDEGTMKVALTLSREGKVESFNIIASSSSSNQTIAQRSLSSISFPPFKDRFKERTKTFTLQLNIDSG